MDYVIQLLIIFCFLYGYSYAESGIDTLENDGCKVYWQEFHPDVDLSEKSLMNKTEAERAKKGLIPSKNFEKNYSRVKGGYKSN